MIHDRISIPCPDIYCKPNNILATVHRFTLVIKGKTECLGTLICPNHQAPYAQKSNTTYWSEDMVIKLLELMELSKTYEEITSSINTIFGTCMKCETRYHNGQSKGKDGPVVKKIEHLRELKMQSNIPLPDAYDKAIISTNIDHKNRTNYWNKYRK